MRTIIAFVVLGSLILPAAAQERSMQDVYWKLRALDEATEKARGEQARRQRTISDAEARAAMTYIPGPYAPITVPAAPAMPSTSPSIMCIGATNIVICN